MITIINNDNIKATDDNIKKLGLVYHHTASRRGYVRVADRGHVLKYEGRDGVVACVCIGRHRGSTQYAEYEFYALAK